MLNSIRIFCKKRKRVLIFFVFAFFFSGISSLITYSLVAPPRDFSISDPRLGDFVVVFYNNKCEATKRQFNEKKILAELYWLGIPEERAVELFTEANENLKKGVYMHDMTGVREYCTDETLQYYDTALRLLKNITRVE